MAAGGDYGLCHAVLELEKAKAGNACFARQLKKCRGACVGAEPMVAHSMRLLEGLSKLRLKAWPFTGPAYLKEGEEVLLVDNWCFLGAVKSDEELSTLFEKQKAQFDRDTYRILSKVVSKMKPLATGRARGSPLLNRSSQFSKSRVSLRHKWELAAAHR